MIIHALPGVVPLELNARGMRKLIRALCERQFMALGHAEFHEFGPDEPELVWWQERAEELNRQYPNRQPTLVLASPISTGKPHERQQATVIPFARSAGSSQPAD